MISGMPWVRFSWAKELLWKLQLFSPERLDHASSMGTGPTWTQASGSLEMKQEDYERAGSQEG